MDDKNKKVVTTKKVIVTNKPKEEIVEPEVTNNVVSANNIQDEGVSSNLEEHLQANINTIEKKKISWKDVLTYFIMVVIVAVCLLLIYVFLDKNNMNPFKPKTTTTTTVDIKKVNTSTATPTSVVYESTTPRATAATHTAMPGNRGSSDPGNVNNTWSRPEGTTTTTVDARTYDVRVNCSNGVKIAALKQKNGAIITAPKKAFTVGDKCTQDNETVFEATEDVTGTLNCTIVNGRASRCKVIATTPDVPQGV